MSINAVNSQCYISEILPCCQWSQDYASQCCQWSRLYQWDIANAVNGHKTMPVRQCQCCQWSRLYQWDIANADSCHKTISVIYFQCCQWLQDYISEMVPMLLMVTSLYQSYIANAVNGHKPISVRWCQCYQWSRLYHNIHTPQLWWLMHCLPLYSKHGWLGCIIIKINIRTGASIKHGVSPEWATISVAMSLSWIIMLIA